MARIESPTWAAPERFDIVSCPQCRRQNRIRAAASGQPRCARCATALPWLTVADDRDFAGVVLNASLPVLLDLWAPWSGLCRLVEPGIQLAAQRYAGRLKAVKINVDEAPEAVSRLAARSIPTLLLFGGGQLRATQIGALPTYPLLDWLRTSLDGVSVQ